MAKAIVLERVGEISYRELTRSDLYKPTPEEETRHGTRVLALQSGDPGPGQVEVEAVLGAICTHEVSLYLGDLTHPRYPMVPGHEAVHRVTRVGHGVTHLREGDYASCCWYMGQWSRRLIGPAESAYRLPDAPGDLARWIVEPAASIVNAVNLMDVKPGMRVLMIGAGFMGLLMTQLLSRYPLTEFVCLDVKRRNRELARQCGAYDVLDPGAGTSALERYGRGFDLVVECSGTQSGLDTAIDQCGMAGTIALFGWHRTARTVDFKLGHLRGQRLLHTSPALDTGRVYERFWPLTIRLIERGVFDLLPLISHRYPAQDVARAFEDSVRRENGFIKSVLNFE